MEGLMPLPLPWQLLRELTCWWLDQRFSMTAKASLTPWNDCGRHCDSDGECHAACDDRIGKNGCQYGAAVTQRRPSVRGLRHVAESDRRFDEGQNDSRP